MLRFASPSVGLTGASRSQMSGKSRTIESVTVVLEDAVDPGLMVDEIAAGAPLVLMIVLFRIVIDYAPDRTEGMTEADMVAAVSAVYGTPRRRTLATAEDPAAPVRPVETVIAQWISGDQSVALLALQGRTAFRVIVASAGLQTLARASGALEGPVDRPDWPSIEAARARSALIGGEPPWQVTRRLNLASFVP
jgi:hypothetical protein